MEDYGSSQQDREFRQNIVAALGEISEIDNSSEIEPEN